MKYKTKSFLITKLFIYIYMKPNNFFLKIINLLTNLFKDLMILKIII